MKLTHIQRNKEIRRAEDAYLDLMKQVDYLFDAVQEYLNKRPIHKDRAEIIRLRDISETVLLLGNLPGELGRSINEWKIVRNNNRSSISLEIEVLNEIWANVICLLMFLMNHQVDMQLFDLRKAQFAIDEIKRANILIE